MENPETTRRGRPSDGLPRSAWQLRSAGARQSESAAEVCSLFAERLEVVGSCDLRDLGALPSFVDLDAEFLDLTGEAFLTCTDLAGHLLEDARELAQRVVPLRDRVDLARAVVPGFDGRGGATSERNVSGSFAARMSRAKLRAALVVAGGLSFGTAAEPVRHRF